MKLLYNRISTHVNILFLLSLTTSFLLQSCGNSKENETELQENYIIKGDTIVLTKASNIKSQITFSTVTEQKFGVELLASGIVKTIPNSYAEIAPPFAGRIIKSHVTLGQKVNVGTPIFTISSPDYNNSQKDYLDAKQEYRQSELQLKRQRDLVNHGVGIRRELEEAETDFMIKKTALANASSVIKIYNSNPRGSKSGGPLTITSPIRGTIITNNVVVGQFLKEDSDPLATVAELSKVWVAGQIKEKDMRFISTLDEVDVKIAAYPNKTIRGKIHYVNNIVNEETRSVEVLIECENPNYDLKPGMFVNVIFKEKPESTILIPSKAVFQNEARQFVFVKIDDNHLIKREIATSDTYDNKIIVTYGLKVGEVILSEGGALMIRNY